MPAYKYKNKPVKKKKPAKKKPTKRKSPAKKKVVKLKKLTKAQKSKLSKHQGHHSAKHNTMMRKLMKEGKSFAAAHRAAKKAVGK